GSTARTCRFASAPSCASTRERRGFRSQDRREWRCSPSARGAEATSRGGRFEPHAGAEGRGTAAAARRAALLPGRLRARAGGSPAGDQGADREAADAGRAGRVVTIRLLLWNLADSKTTLDELRAKLPELPEGDRWISDPASERFGLISFSGALQEVDRIRNLIGKDPEIGEEFELEA